MLPIFVCAERRVGQAASISSYEYSLNSYIEEAQYFRNEEPTKEWHVTEVARETHQLGDVAHVFSFYIFGPDAEGSQAKRCTASFHLAKTDHIQQRGTTFHRSTKWQITSWHWTTELPEERTAHP